jgi:hypothetical protein
MDRFPNRPVRFLSAHPQSADAHELALDRLSPTSTPVVLFRVHTADRHGVVAFLEASERQRIYKGRLVVVRRPNGHERRGCVEVTVENQVLVRWL